MVKVSSDGSLDLYLRHGIIAVAMDLEVNGDQSEEKGTINRYVLSGDLVAGRVSTTVNADGSTVSEKSFYHLDHLNSTKVVKDEAGEVVVNYTYRAFGEQLKRLDKSNNPTEDEAKYSYSGKELDEDINLYYFNARFYDATTGRFINVDPVQDGLNWYVYCSNNPLAMVDPTGLEDTKITTVTEDVKEVTQSDLNEYVEQLAADRDKTVSNQSMSDLAVGAGGVAVGFVVGSFVTGDPLVGALVGGVALGTSMINDGDKNSAQDTMDGITRMQGQLLKEGM